MKPLIGITCNYLPSDSWGFSAEIGTREQDWHLLAGDYVNSVRRAGGDAVILPMDDDIERIRALADRLDGVIISGGNDVCPEFYGESAEAEENTGSLIPMRDLFDAELTRYVLERTSKPILGICRGIQIMNAAMGGTLYQDLGSAGFERHSMTPCPRNAAFHSVELKEGCFLSKLYSSDNIKVNWLHHQGVKDLAACFKAIGKSEDGVTEAVVVPGKRFAAAVQWHPEMMYDSEQQQRLFENFIEACSD
ncbi:MAG: gamma-glutamyl-gamma-aminobutyrate hydrolase family protein [Synergistaceae bacterium]|nr:gamma-glutamyl-gamma-aminobutyrate hydrolase family protein [Synergistaceae bacterium]